MHSESEGPVHFEQDEWQPAQALGLTPVFLYSPSGHVDSQVFEVVSIFVESHSVHWALDPEHSKQSLWQL